MLGPGASGRLAEIDAFTEIALENVLPAPRDREAVILEEAVRLAETGRPQPSKLILDGGAPVMRHPLERARPFGFVAPRLTSPRFVPALVERGEPR